MSAAESERLATLREIVAGDPDDLFGRLLLGRELLAAGLFAESVVHLSAYVARESGDKGAACGALAQALVALGRKAEADAVLEQGIENAKVHHHLGLVASLTEQREALA